MLGPKYSNYSNNNFNTENLLLDASSYISNNQSSDIRSRSSSPAPNLAPSPPLSTISASGSTGPISSLSTQTSSVFFFPTYDSLSKMKMYGSESKKLQSGLNEILISVSSSQSKRSNSSLISSKNKTSPTSASIGELTLQQLLSYYKKIGDFFYPPLGISQLWELIEQGLRYIYYFKKI
jgi:hypothetical protein